MDSPVEKADRKISPEEGYVEERLRTCRIIFPELDLHDLPPSHSMGGPNILVEPLSSHAQPRYGLEGLQLHPELLEGLSGLLHIRSHVALGPIIVQAILYQLGIKALNQGVAIGAGGIGSVQVVLNRDRAST